MFFAATKFPASHLAAKSRCFTFGIGLTYPVMDISKLRLDRLLYVIGGVIPGFVALLIYRVAAPNSFAWFLSLGSLGYQTKLGIVLVTALLVGRTLTAFLTVFLGAIGGVIGHRLFKPPHALSTAPWRDPTWRAALSRVLGEPPKDTQRWQAWFYEQKLRQIESLPEAQQPLARTRLELERLENEGEDREWARWYDHYHKLVLQPSDQDVLFHVHRGLNFNLQVAAVYVLVSLWFVPAIRLWWCILPASFWIRNPLC